MNWYKPQTPVGATTDGAKVIALATAGAAVSEQAGRSLEIAPTINIPLLDWMRYTLTSLQTSLHLSLTLSYKEREADNFFG